MGQLPTWLPGHFSFRFLSTIFLLFVCVAAPDAAFADTANPASIDEQIRDAEIEDLLNMQVTSVSNAPENLRTSSAAVSVITSEDIRRSGVTSVMEALRGVPGVNVARQEQNKWAISIRGFNHRTSNKLLVLIDGRSIYDPLFSGTFWEVRDVFLEDVERIEVVRGPGGSTWGANAVNGVISIITKHAADTQGSLVSAGGGTEERVLGSVRHGGKISEDTFYRIYSRYVNRDNGYLAEGASDDSYNGQAGFRVDSRLGKDETLNLQGQIFQGDNEGVVGDFNTLHGEGGSVQGRWERRLSESSVFSTDGYYDHFDFDSGILGERRETGEVNIKEEHTFSDRFSSITALQYRYTTDQTFPSQIFSVDPDERNDHLYGGSFSGKYRAIKDVLDLHAGVKIQHNDYSGVEVQPDAGFAWTVNAKHTLWGSVSRAVRTPSRLENDFAFTLPETGQVVLRGNSDIEAENLLSYQLGHHFLLREDMLLSTTAFFNVYEDLLLGEGTTINNTGHGDTYGAELAATWSATSWWELRGAYSYLKVALSPDSDSTADPSVFLLEEGSAPQHQAVLTSRIDLPAGFELDGMLRYVDRLYSPDVASYVVADLRLGYRVSENLELSVVGQNLFDDHHFEQGGPEASQVQQGVYGKAVLTF